MMEELMGFPGDSDFVKSFREGSKVSIVCRVENKNGRFLEAAAYGVRGRRVGCGFGSSLPAEKVGGKKVEPRTGKVLNCNSSSFVEVVWAELCSAATALFTSSRQGNPLGKEHADSVRLLGFSSDGLQGKDRLCFVPSDVACSVVFAEQELSSQAEVKEMLGVEHRKD